MTARVLIASVGGSNAPIVHAIREAEPAHVLFLCSEDAKDRPGSWTQVEGILAEAGLPELSHEIVRVEALDDLGICYEAAIRAIGSLRGRFPEADVAVDYTGGTKSMSAGLAAAALDRPPVEISVISGERRNLVSVTPGTSFARPVEIGEILARRRLSEARILMASFDYAALSVLARELEADAPPQLKPVARNLDSLSQAFGAWDRFDHVAALADLAPYRIDLPAHVDFLEAVLSSRAVLDPKLDVPRSARGHGFEIVQDLVLNAARRADQSRYDDAMGRLYRATEMLVQIHLKRAYGLDTGDLDPTRMPTEALRRFESRKTKPLQSGLMESYWLLQHFPGDALWPIFEESQDALRGTLELRHQSLFAHGFRPIEEPAYRDAEARLTEFMERGIRAIVGEAVAPAPQFPRELPL